MWLNYDLQQPTLERYSLSTKENGAQIGYQMILTKYCLGSIADNDIVVVKQKSHF